MFKLTKIVFAVKAAATLAAGGESVDCEVEALEAYGFEQFSTNIEYVCVNETDYTDFIIIEDEEAALKVGDNIIVLLNEHDEVIAQIKKD